MGARHKKKEGATGNNNPWGGDLSVKKPRPKVNLVYHPRAAGEGGGGKERENPPGPRGMTPGL